MSATGLPFLHPLFSAGMVLPRDRPLPVWGWCAPGAAVTVTLADTRVMAVADADGRWQALLSPLPAGGPHALVIAGDGQQARCDDVLVGEVWLCAGQSNLEFTVARTEDAQRAALLAAADPALPLRLFALGRRTRGAPGPLPPGPAGGCGPLPTWRHATPEAVSAFSAVAWAAAESMQRKLGVPVGVVASGWAGSNIRAWMSEGALAGLGMYAAERAEVAARAAVEASNGTPVAAQERGELDAWWRAHDPGVAGGWQRPEVTDEATGAAWAAQAVPGTWSGDGAVWLRRWVDLPPEAAGKAGVLRLGGMRDEETVWVNGVRTGSGEIAAPHANAVPAATLRAGLNLIALHLWAQGGRGALGAVPGGWRLEVDGVGHVPLADGWILARGAAGEPVRPRERFQGMNGSATMHYNGAIAPLAPFPFSGALWYQGEQDSGDPAYQDLLPALIADWRRTFSPQAGAVPGVPPLPFVVVQLPAFRPPVPDAVEVSAPFALTRDAQLQAARSIPGVGLAVTIDLGDPHDVHPARKREVGERAAAAIVALRDPASPGGGPRFADATFAAGVARVRFSNVRGALRVDGADPGGFALAGADGNWHHARARVVAPDTVEVISAAVPAPQAVRYAWAGTPPLSLYDADAPASPFRSD